MNSEKIIEIKKALEDNKTDHLPYIDEWKCKFVDYADILTLINELESENEKLQRDCVITAYDKLRAENKKLKDRLGELEEKIIDETLVEFNKPFYSNQFNAWCIYLKDGDYITSLCLTKEQAEARLLELKKGITK